MADDLVAVGRAAQELEPAAREFAKAIGRTGPVAEFVEWITDEIRYRREPRKARLLVQAASLIRESGLPPHAVDDRLLRAVLEDGALTDDERLQDRWAHLLANGAVAPTAPHVAFAGVLAQLEGVEVQMLQRMHDAIISKVSAHEAGEISDFEFLIEGFGLPFFGAHCGVDRWSYPTAAANLRRLQLADVTGHDPDDPPEQHEKPAATHDPVPVAITLTYFGAGFVAACSPPGAPSLVKVLGRPT